MAKYQRFEEIPVWQEAARLYQHVLDVVEEPNVPLSATFKNQLERASLTVSNAVAEGFEARGAELVALLNTARGAAREVQSMVAIITERPKVTRLREPLQQIGTSADSCARQLGSWKWIVENPGGRKSGGQEAAGQSGGGRGANPNWRSGAGAENRAAGQSHAGGAR
jgi:four helix bundle protein